MKNFVLDPEVMKTWSRAMWCFFFLFVALIVAILYDDLSSLHTVGYLKYYILWAVIFLGLMGWMNNKQTAQGKVIHIHHYFVGVTMCTFICYQDVLLSVCHGFFFGMFLEGGCRWGYDPVWEIPDPDPQPDPDEPEISNEDLVNQKDHTPK